MTMVFKNRVSATTTTTGTGPFVVSGAVPGYRAISLIGDGNKSTFRMEMGNQFCIFIGTYTAAGNSLSVDTVLDSSSGGAAVNWGAGKKTVSLVIVSQRQARGTPGEVTVSDDEETGEFVIGLAAAAPQNEIQRIAITGNPDGGTFNLALGAENQNFPFDSNSTGIDTGLEAFAAIGSGNLTTSGGPLPGAFVDVEFSGGPVAETNVNEMTIDTSGLTKTAPAVLIETITDGSAPTAGVNEQQEFALLGSPTGGQFQITLTGYGNAYLDFDADNAAIEAGFAAMGISIPTNVTGGPLPDSPVQVEMDFGGTNLPQMQIDPSGLTGGAISATITTTQEGDPGGIPEPVSYWQCEEASGNLEDYYGHHSLTDVVTPGTTTGLVGDARYLDGTNGDRFESTDSEFQSSTSFTVCGWVKFSPLPDPGQNPQILFAFGHRNGSSGVTCYLIYYEAISSIWQFYVAPDDFPTNAGDGAYAQIVETAVVDTWYFVAMSFDRATKELRCSLNGGAVSSMTMTADPYLDDGSDCKFQFANAAASVVQSIDEWGWWNEVLSDEHILQIYNEGVGVTAPFSGDPPTNEIQQLATTGSPTQGTFTLTYDGQTTTAIPYNASTANVGSALESLSNIGSGQIDCGGGPLPSPINIEFKGTLAATNVVEITVNDDLLQYTVTTLQDGAGATAGVDEEQQITLLNDVTGGVFSLSFDGDETDAIPFDATSADVFDALVALPSIESADLVVTGGPLPNTPVSITFTGATWGEQDVPEMAGDASGLTQDPIVGTVETIQDGGGASGGCITQIPSGTIDGANDTFTLTNTPLSGSLMLTLNGLVLFNHAGGDYVLNGTTITFHGGALPQTGDRLVAYYRI